MTGSRDKAFDALNGLRFFLFVPIFFLHATGNRDLWLNSTMFALDYFFVLAGFMAAVGRFNADYVTWNWLDIGKSSMRYLWKKLVTFYPLHLTCFFSDCCVVVCCTLSCRQCAEGCKRMVFSDHSQLATVAGLVLEPGD